MECFSDSEAYNVTYSRESNNFNCNDQRDSVCAYRNIGKDFFRLVEYNVSDDSFDNGLVNLNDNT